MDLPSGFQAVSDWQGGHHGGALRLHKSRYQVTFVQKQGSNKVTYFNSFRFEEGQKEKAYQQALEWKAERSLLLGATKNRYRFVLDNNKNEVVEMQLDGGYSVFFDKWNLDLVLPYTWSKSSHHGTVYANSSTFIRQGKGTKIMHRLFLPDASIIDHINGNGLDNRLVNLRSVTSRQNSNNMRLQARNRSGENGISILGKTVVFQWREENKNVSKRFSVKKYISTESAFEAAIHYRDHVVYPRIKNENGKRPKSLQKSNTHTQQPILKKQKTINQCFTECSYPQPPDPIDL